MNPPRTRPIPEIFRKWLTKKPSNNASKRSPPRADSRDTVELSRAVEEEFRDELKGEIPEADAEKLQTVGQVIDYIKGKAGAA